MSKVIVGAKKRVNPFVVGQVFTVVVGSSICLLLTALFWHQAMTFSGDPASNAWWIGAIIGLVACIGGGAWGFVQFYSFCAGKARTWNAYSD